MSTQPYSPTSNYTNLPGCPNIFVRQSTYQGDDGTRWPKADAYMTSQIPIHVQLIGFGRSPCGSIEIDHSSISVFEEKEHYNCWNMRKGYKWYIGYVFELESKKVLFGKPLMEYYGDAYKYC